MESDIWAFVVVLFLNWLNWRLGNGCEHLSYFCYERRDWDWGRPRPAQWHLRTTMLASMAANIRQLSLFFKFSRAHLSFLPNPCVILIRASVHVWEGTTQADTCLWANVGVDACVEINLESKRRRLRVWLIRFRVIAIPWRNGQVFESDVAKWEVRGEQGSRSLQLLFSTQKLLVLPLSFRKLRESKLRELCFPNKARERDQRIM